MLEIRSLFLGSNRMRGRAQRPRISEEHASSKDARHLLILATQKSRTWMAFAYT